jgi:hypothetical protein
MKGKRGGTKPDGFKQVQHTTLDRKDARMKGWSRNPKQGYMDIGKSEDVESWNFMGRERVVSQGLITQEAEVESQQVCPVAW